MQTQNEAGGFSLRDCDVGQFEAEGKSIGRETVADAGFGF
jgi:hypothetical protein